MEGWMHGGGWMVGRWMDGWMDRWVGGWMVDGWKDGCMGVDDDVDASMAVGRMNEWISTSRDHHGQGPPNEASCLA